MRLCRPEVPFAEHRRSAEDGPQPRRCKKEPQRYRCQDLELQGVDCTAVDKDGPLKRFRAGRRSFGLLCLGRRRACLVKCAERCLPSFIGPSFALASGLERVLLRLADHWRGVHACPDAQDTHATAHAKRRLIGRLQELWRLLVLRDDRSSLSLRLEVLLLALGKALGPLRSAERCRLLLLLMVLQRSRCGSRPLSVHRARDACRAERRLLNMLLLLVVGLPGLLLLAGGRGEGLTKRREVEGLLLG